MADKDSKISQTNRIKAIQRELLNSGEVSTSNLAKKFNVSSMTIHRDLELLKSQGEIFRTYGGANLAQKLTFEFSFQDKRQVKQNEKKKIAKEALKFIENGQAILLDTGTTALEIACHL